MLKEEKILPEPELSELERKILGVLGETPLSVDQISSSVAKRFEEVASSLLSLELRGIIRMLSGQRYAKN